MTSSSEKLALEGGLPVRDLARNPWPDWPQNSQAEWDAEIEPALRNVFMAKVEGLPSRQGEDFGQAFARYHQAQYGLMMPHGTDAIMAALAGALDLDGLGEGGQVIIPNYTFIATASAALFMRCSLALVDVDPVSFTMAPEAVEAAITEKTVAILPVHLGGHPADMDALNAIAKKHNLTVIEDCAQAHGAEYKGRKVGALGDVGAFSFQSSKNLTSGEGGCLVTNNEDIWSRAYAFRDVGRRPGGERWEYPRLGWNYRVSEYLAAMLQVRLTKLEEETQLRNENAVYLSECLDDIDGITPPRWQPWTSRHGYHLYMMLYDAAEFGGRDRVDFVQALQAEGVPCTPGYERPLTDEGALTTVAAQYPHLVQRHPCPNIESLSERSVWLYQSMLLGSRRDMDDIVAAVAKIKRAFAG